MLIGEVFSYGRVAPCFGGSAIQTAVPGQCSSSLGLRPRYEEHCPLSIPVLNSPERELSKSVVHFKVQVVKEKSSVYSRMYTVSNTVAGMPAVMAALMKVLVSMTTRYLVVTVIKQRG